MITQSQDDRDLFSARSRAIYDAQLKHMLEPEHNGQIVAIHTETGDYAVAKNSPDARRALRARQPDGPIMTTNIGPAQMDSLTLRYLGGKRK